MLPRDLLTFACAEELSDVQKARVHARSDGLIGRIYECISLSKQY